MKDIFNQLDIKHKPADTKNWFGRETFSKKDKLYWHQNIIFGDSEKLEDTDVSLIGYTCQEGVFRNQGRVGTKEAPKTIRHQLGKFSFHHQKKVSDFGDITCVDDNMEDCQKALANFISKTILSNTFPIAIGGGHDIAFGHFMGIKKALEKSPEKKIGIINFDAHFDLRKVEEKPNSGTPFHQIINELEKENKTIDYFAIGIQPSSNTKELFKTAENNNINFIESYDCDVFSENLKNKLTNFINSVDYIYITIDMDGFSSAYAPGVSAPSAIGFSPNFVFKILDYLFSTKKVISCDIAELNPKYDIDNRTANLAAKLVDYIVSKVE
ncbi:MAG: formimidoylglutamase [Polaribacter sp.]